MIFIVYSFHGSHLVQVYILITAVYRDKQNSNVFEFVSVSKLQSIINERSVYFMINKMGKITPNTFTAPYCN